ncbi:MAG: hypothetical protein MK106_01435 [Mariniblastus sp.]|nr:hypothetical protein [Mariniblastus sp.]
MKQPSSGIMTKYYIQSGNASWTVQAKDAEGAALWLLNQTIQPYLPLTKPGESSSEDEDRLFGILEGLAQLAPEIQVSQIGPGHTDAGRFDTGEIFNTWRRLSSSLDRLFDSFN